MTTSLDLSTEVPVRLRWDDPSRRQEIMHLYSRGRAGQWDVEDIDWSVEVEFGADVPDDEPIRLLSLAGSPLESLGPSGAIRFRWEFQAWMMSQFLHGEQAALVAAGRLIEAAPDVESKFYAAVQAYDEARHVDAFERYLDRTIEHRYPVSSSTVELVELILGERDWDMTYLGMQVIVEGLALAGFRLGAASFADPVARELCRRVGEDEARHVAFGVLSLRDLYAGLSTAERRHREDFVIEAAELIRRRFLLDEIWKELGVDVLAGRRFAAADPLLSETRRLLFNRVAATLGRLQLVSDRVSRQLQQLELVRP